MSTTMTDQTRADFLAFDPRLAGVDAMIYVDDDDRLDLWARHSHESRERPTHHHPLRWKEDSMGKWSKIGGDDERPVCVSWFFAVVDGRVLCFYEVTSQAQDLEMALAWARLFSERVFTACDDALDIALQSGAIPGVGLPVYRDGDEALRVQMRAEWDARAAESKRITSMPALASPEQVAAGIPPIADRVLAERAAALRPLVVRGDKLFNVPRQTDLRGESFSWTEPGREAIGLVAAKTVITLHTYTYYGFFKPTVAEVLAQAPDDWANYSAFSVAGPDSADEMNREHVAFKAGLHVAVTTYYQYADSSL